MSNDQAGLGGLSDQELLRCAKIATPCYNLKLWERELDMMRAAIAADRGRLCRPELMPVPVSEFPWKREGWCNADGKCWLRRKCDHGITWRLMAPASVFEDAMQIYYAEALPANALPYPDADNV
jgi:hypothetical protein